ncbi:hypothetical protein H4K36_28770 [Streptomyces sp. DHE7-1]|nr:hypothetical protein [Streptomyces sp. DHE7-1]
MTVERLGEDGVLRGLDQRGEFGDAFLGGLAFADVAYGGGDEEAVGGLEGLRLISTGNSVPSLRSP